MQPKQFALHKGEVGNGHSTFRKKTFFAASSDIPKRIWKVVGGGDLSDSPQKSMNLSF